MTQSGSCDNRGPCLGGVFVLGHDYSIEYDCCDFNLCNSPEYAAKKQDYKCEFNRQVPKTKKLKFPILNPKTSNVKQCYYCENCSTYESAKIVKCSERNATIEAFACSVIRF